jgi:hypothetical protein
MFIITGKDPLFYHGAEHTREAAIEPTLADAAKQIMDGQVEDAHRVLQIGALDFDVSRKVAHYIGQSSHDQCEPLCESAVAFCIAHGVTGFYSEADAHRDGYIAERDHASLVRSHNLQVR